MSPAPPRARRGEGAIGANQEPSMDDQACERPVIRIRQLLSEEAANLALCLRAGAKGLDKEIFIPRIQKPGLALAGFMARFRKWGRLSARRRDYRGGAILRLE